MSDAPRAEPETDPAHPPRRRRVAARIVLLDEAGSVLLFRFAFSAGPWAGVPYWATPGGEVEPGETLAAAAGRELHEETGLRAAIAGPVILTARFPMLMHDGEPVEAEEHFFLLRAPRFEPDPANRTALERTALVEHRWWSGAALRAAAERVYPAGLADLVAAQS